MNPTPATTAEQLLAWYDEPAVLGKLASEASRHMFQGTVLVRAAQTFALDGAAVVVRSGDRIHCTSWPSPESLQDGDELHIEVSLGEQRCFADYLISLRTCSAARITLLPGCRDAGGLHRLWLLAAARVALDAHVRVAAQFDRIGIRLAQVALAFGADALCGTISPARTLPLAGVTRPDETSLPALTTLITQAGLRPITQPEATA